MTTKTEHDIRRALNPTPTPEVKRTRGRQVAEWICNHDDPEGTYLQAEPFGRSKLEVEIWYINMPKRAGKKAQKKHLTVFFDNPVTWDEVQRPIFEGLMPEFMSKKADSSYNPQKFGFTIHKLKRWNT